jgi:hypothetical protein
MNPAAFGGPAIGPVPIEFILFAFVLLGVALFHHHTLRIALTGAIACCRAFSTTWRRR